MKWVSKETVNLRILVPSGLSVAVLVGFSAGYLVARKIAQNKYRNIADAEIQEAKVYYQNMYSKSPMIFEPEEKEPEQTGWDDLATPKERRIAQAVEALEKYNPAEREAIRATGGPDLRPQPVIVNNIFQTHTPPGEEVMAALLAERDTSRPYIITKEEYYQNDPDHEQRAFTYYEGDDVLVDDQEEYNPIEDTDRVAGDDNLLRFGYGSADENTLYIRNESVDPPFDMCIVRSDGKYGEEVMGFMPEGEEIVNPIPRRFQPTDE